MATTTGNSELVEKILATIRAVESDGNYTAKNPGSSASGAYQFIDSTWRSVGGAIYAPRAYMATPAQQDLVARAYVEKILAQHPGKDPAEVVPRVWYVGTLDLPDSHRPKGNKLTVGQYVSEWKKELAAQIGSGVAGAPIDRATDWVGDQLAGVLGAAVDPFVQGLRRLTIIGAAVTAGMALVVLGAWRGVKSGG